MLMAIDHKTPIIRQVSSDGRMSIRTTPHGYLAFMHSQAIFWDVGRIPMTEALRQIYRDMGRLQVFMFPVQ